MGKVKSLIVVAVATLVVGCGTTVPQKMSEPQYYDFAQEQMAKFFQTVKSEDLSIDEYWTLKKPIQQELTVIQSIHKKFNGVTPPSLYSNDHRELVAALEAFEERDKDLLAYSEDGDGDALGKAIEAFRAGLDHLDKATKIVGEESK